MWNTKLFISINSAITGFYMLSYFLIFGKNIFHLNNDKAIQLLKEKVYDKYMEETGRKRPLPQDYLFRTWLFEYEKKDSDMKKLEKHYKQSEKSGNVIIKMWIYFVIISFIYAVITGAV